MIKNKAVLLLIILLVATFLRGTMLVEKPLALDEPHTIKYINRSFDGMYQYILSERKTPIYYLIVWPLYYLTASELLLKIVSVIFGLLSVLGVYFLGKTMFDERTGLMASFLLALSPFHIGYSQYVREYILFFLFFVLSMIFFYRCLKTDTRKNWMLLAAANAAFYLTHFLAIHMIIAQFLILLTLKIEKKRTLIKNYAIQGLAVFLIVLPWNIVLFGTADIFGVGVPKFDYNPLRMGYALYKISAGANISGLLTWFAPLVGIMLPFFALIFVLAFFHFARNDRERGKILFGGMLIPTALLFLMAATLVNLFNYRYLFPLVSLYLIAISSWMLRIKQRKIRFLAFAILIALYIAADIYYYSVITLPTWPLKFGL